MSAVLSNKFSATITVSVWPNAAEQAANQQPLGSFAFQVNDKGTPPKDVKGRDLALQPDGSYKGPDGLPATIYAPAIPPIGTVLGGAITADMVGKKLSDVVSTLLEAAVQTQPKIVGLTS